MMNILTKKQYWDEMYRRLQLINWDVPVTKEDVDALHAALPPREIDETIPDWLKRVFKKPEEIDWLTELRRAAAHSGLEAFPLPERPMLTEDENFIINIYREDGKIVVQVKTYGEAFKMNKFAGNTLILADENQKEVQIAELTLDEDGVGEVRLEDSVEIRQILSNLGIGRKKVDD